MKINLLSIIALTLLTFSVNAATYMQVKCTNGNMDNYDVEDVLEVDYGVYMDTIYYTVDTAGTKEQGVSVSGKMGEYTYVDLELPSGLLWATYNVGTTTPKEVGDLFAWGEFEPKSEYNWKTYKWCTTSSNGSVKSFTKYNDSDTLKVLSCADDAATEKWGAAWRMPTSEEQKELMTNCTWWRAPLNGVNGFFGKSKINGKTIFFCSTNVPTWSSSLYQKDKKYAYDIEQTNEGKITTEYVVLRKNAGNIRPVTVKNDFIDTVTYMQVKTIDDDVKRYNVNKVERIDYEKKHTVNFYTQDSVLIESQLVVEGSAAIAPEPPCISDSLFTGWSTTFKNVVTNMDVYARYRELVMVTDTIDGYAYVDLGLGSGLKWAVQNVGAEKITDAGDYFSWGETETKTCYSDHTDKWASDWTHIKKYCTDGDYGVLDNKTTLDAEDDAASVQMGGAWRIPTSSECAELIRNCEWQWVKNFKCSGVDGVLGFSKVNGNAIFLPAVGRRYDGSSCKTKLHDVGTRGICLTSTLGGNCKYFNTIEFSATGYQNNSGRGIDLIIVNSWTREGCGLSVRAICK